MDGYKEAFKVDFVINSLLSQYPIIEDNVLEWMKYARTIQTSANIILMLSKVVISKADKLKAKFMFEDLEI